MDRFVTIRNSVNVSPRSPNREETLLARSNDKKVAIVSKNYSAFSLLLNTLYFFGASIVE